MSMFSVEEIALPRPNYEYISRADAVPKALEEISKYPTIEVDTEATGLDPFSAKPVLAQIGIPNKAFVFDIRHDTDHSDIGLSMLKPVLTGDDQLRLFQNAVFDMKMIKVHGGFYVENIYDTLLVEQLFCLGLPRRNSLDRLVKRYLGISMNKEPRGTFSDYNQTFKPFQLEYAANDVVVLELIRQMQLPRIRKEGFENVCRLEFEFTKPMCEMELNGITIDPDKWRIMVETMDIEKEKTSKIVSEMLETTVSQNTLFGVSLINIDSNKQLKSVLNSFGLNLEKTDVGALQKYAGVPVVDALLDYRKAQKFVSTYGESLLAQIHENTGRLHTNFKQMVATGRMSSSAPNLQNIPKKQKYRSCFVAKPGYTLITADMSGCELRILGNLSEDPVFLDCYANDIDLHTRTAAEVNNIPMESVKGVMRNAAKAINFGLCLSEDTDVYTNFGTHKIKNIKPSTIIAHDVGTDKIIDGRYMGQKEIFEIESKYGYILEATSDHLIKIIDINGNYVDKKIEDLDIDKDFVCIKLGADVFPKSDFLFDKFTIEKRTNFIDFVLPNVINDDWAKFLGLFVSEGHLHKGKSGNYNSIQFGFSSKEKNLISFVDSLLTRLFGKFSRTCKNDMINYSVNSVKIAMWIFSICNFNPIRKTDTINIPECIKSSSKNIQISFLRALFEGDGTIWKAGKTCCIKYDSKSLLLIKDVQLMLLNLGILTSLRLYKDKRYLKNNYYSLDVIGHTYKKKFMKSVGFLTQYKNNKWFCDQTYTRSCFILPYQEKRAVKIRNLLRCVKNRTNKDWNSIRYLYNSVNLTDIRGIGSFYFEQLSEYDDFIKFIYEKGIIPLPIKSIKSKGMKRVYDLSVDNHQYFIANGFIVHNCYGLSKYGLAKRLSISEKEAEDMINVYFQKYSGVKSYLDDAEEEAVMKRYTRTVGGRKRFYRIPEWDDPDKKTKIRAVGRQGKNAGIQGSLCFNSKIKGLGDIGKQLDKTVLLETGFGKDTALGVYSGKKKVYNLKLSNGVELGITLNHKIPTISKSSSTKIFRDVPAEDLIEDDLIMVPLNIVGGKVTDLSGYKYKKGHWRETYIDYNYPCEMNKELAFILGCLIGDGSYSKHDRMTFVCPSIQKELFDKFNRCIRKVFNYEPHISFAHKNDHKRKPLPLSGIYSVVIRGFLKHIGLGFVKHHDKVVPEYFYTETIENRGAILNGLFSTDGGMFIKSGPQFTTVSKKLANSVHQLLFSLGINSNLKIYNNEYGKVYRLQVPKRFNSKFKKYVGFSIKNKQHLLEKNCIAPKFGDNSIVPEFIPKTIERVLRRNPFFFTNFTSNEKAHLRRFKLGKCSYTSWRKFYDRLPECEDKRALSKYLNYDFCQIKELEYKGKEDTYDLICDNIHYFTANGVIVHNSNADTIKEAMILCVDRLEEGKYDAKLLLTVHDEIIVEVRDDQIKEVSEIVTSSLVDGFGKYFTKIPMETEALVGPCWLKGECEECKCTEMKFIPDEKYKTKLVCSNCGEPQE